MIKDVTMRNKTKLIDSFIRKEVDEDQQGFMKGKADGSIDLETRLNNFVSEERNKALVELAEQENIPIEALKKFIDEYEYLHREKSEIIHDAVKDKKMKYKERKSLMSRVLARLHAIVSVFFWE
jgi:type I restriction enzyme R subunit